MYKILSELYPSYSLSPQLSSRSQLWCLLFNRRHTRSLGDVGGAGGGGVIAWKRNVRGRDVSPSLGEEQHFSVTWNKRASVKYLSTETGGFTQSWIRSSGFMNIVAPSSLYGVISESHSKPAVQNNEKEKNFCYHPKLLKMLIRHLFNVTMRRMRRRGRM